MRASHGDFSLTDPPSFTCTPNHRLYTPAHRSGRTGFPGANLRDERLPDREPLVAMTGIRLNVEAEVHDDALS